VTTFEARPTGRVTVCRSPDVDEADLRKYLERLLSGLVEGEGIVIVTPSSTAEPSDETAGAALPIVYQPCARPGRRSHLDWLATAGALLVCATVVLDLGRFVSPEKLPVEPAIAMVSQPDEPSGPVARVAAAELPPQQAPDPVASQPGFSAGDPELVDRLAYRHAGEPDADIARTVAAAHTVAAPLTTAALWSSLPDRAAAAEWPKEEGAAVQPSGQPAPPPENQADRAEEIATPGSTIVGVWAPDAATCSAHQFRDGALPTVITNDGAWAGDTFCLFTKQQQTDDGWRVVAKCSNPRERWTSQVRLTVKDQRLTWSSRRGVQAYARCTPDLLMANR
jgi:hypothetical protein